MMKKRELHPNKKVRSYLAVKWEENHSVSQISKIVRTANYHCLFVVKSEQDWEKKNLMNIKHAEVITIINSVPF